MHILAHGSQVATAAPIDDQGFVAATEQAPESPVPPVEPRGVSAQEPLHSGHQIGLRRFRHQMKMIAHQTIGMDLPGSLEAGFGQCFKEPFPIRVILENRLRPFLAPRSLAYGTGARTTRKPWMVCSYLGERLSRLADRQPWPALV